MNQSSAEDVIEDGKVQRTEAQQTSGRHIQLGMSAVLAFKMQSLQQLQA
jgi:hypothetical protein